MLPFLELGRISESWHAHPSLAVLGKTEKAANRVMIRTVSPGEEERKVAPSRQLGPGCEAANCE